MTRRFSAAPIPSPALDDLLDLARRAPSAGFSQGVHFLVLEGSDLSRFWQVSGLSGWFSERQPGVLGAPAAVVAVGDPQAYTDRYASVDKVGHGLERTDAWDVPFWVADTAMAVQQLLLLAEDRGLGALYFGVFRNRAAVHQAFGIPDHMIIVGAVALGERAADDVPSGSPQHRPRLPVDQVIHHGQWLR